jgi:hypothetical protein
MSQDLDEFDFKIDAAASAGSSGEAFSARPPMAPTEPYVANEADDDASAVFKLLSRPELPELEHDTRARLMMQSPTRLYFYWSVGDRSGQALKRVAGAESGDYRLVLRLVDADAGTEELHAIEAEGSWWFNVKPDTSYRAEIGFYSSSRPFIRILFSNTITTPRKAPSAHSASEARWAVTTREFAEVLDASGFEDSALEAVSDPTNIRERFAQQIGTTASAIAALDESEISRALQHLITGQPIEDLKYDLSAELFELLQANLSRLSPGSLDEFAAVEGLTTSTAAGGSLVNMPRRRRRHLSSINLP